MIKYGLIARGAKILADYTDQDGDFPQAAKKVLAKARKNEKKQTLQQNNFIFTFLKEDEYSFLAMTQDQPGAKDFASLFIDNLKQEFKDNYSNNDENWQKTLTASIQRLIKDSNEQIKTDKVEQLEGQLEEVQDMAQKSIDQLLEREVKLDVLSEKSKNLSVSSNHLKSNARRLRKKIEDDQFPTQKIYALLALGFVAFLFLVFKRIFFTQEETQQIINSTTTTKLF